MITPTRAVVDAANKAHDIMDPDGRRITVRRLNALDKLRLLKAAGAELAQNEPWLGIAMLASSVTALDGVPVPMAANERQIEAIVAQLGDTGLGAVADALASDAACDTAEQVARAGN